MRVESRTRRECWALDRKRILNRVDWNGQVFAAPSECDFGSSCDIHLHETRSGWNSGSGTSETMISRTPVPVHSRSYFARVAYCGILGYNMIQRCAKGGEREMACCSKLLTPLTTFRNQSNNRAPPRLSLTPPSPHFPPLYLAYNHHISQHSRRWARSNNCETRSERKASHDSSTSLASIHSALPLHSLRVLSIV